MAMSYAERKAKALARRDAERALAQDYVGEIKSILSPMPYTPKSVLDGVPFVVENLTPMELDVEFVGDTITIKQAGR